jgi:hypothetical protein
MGGAMYSAVAVSAHLRGETGIFPRGMTTRQLLEINMVKQSGKWQIQMIARSENYQ